MVNNKVSKKALSYVVMVSMLFALFTFAVSASTDQILSGSTVLGTPGENLTVEFSLNDGVDLSAISFRIGFDSEAFSVSDEDLDFDGSPDSIITPSGLNMGNITSGIFNEQGYINIAAARSGGNPVPEGAAGLKVSIVNVVFNIKGEVYNGTYPITISNIYAAGYDGEIIIGEPVGGSITVTGGEDPPTGVDKAALAEKISYAGELNEADYTAATWADLVTALAAANDVNDDADATQQEVNDALAALQTAIDDLEDAPVVEETTIVKGSD